MGRKLIEYPPVVTAYWESYYKRNHLPKETRWAAWSFGDTPRLADELLNLALTGKKRGTADLVAIFRHNGDPLPEVGKHSVVLDGRGYPAAIIKTSKVEIKPFPEVRRVRILRGRRRQDT